MCVGGGGTTCLSSVTVVCRAGGESAGGDVEPGGAGTDLCMTGFG